MTTKIETNKSLYVNNENLLLQAGSDTFILMQDCRFNLDRPISRQTTSGGGVVYFFGAGDNSIDFTLLTNDNFGANSTTSPRYFRTNSTS